ncbi:MAG: DUF4965 domain-containing protein, partial [Lachnospiraceae bacterium]|nr:DUF4965 domain-containing protein [Lachnospiraceae bacterium]
MLNLSGYPAVPLFTHDPYFSVWDVSPIPTAADPHHWAGRELPFRFGVTVDGVEMRFFGRSGKKPMKITSVKVTPLSALYRFEEAGIAVNAKFTSPLLLDDLDILSTPISYLELSAESVDGKEHDVRFKVTAPTQMVQSGDNVPALRIDTFRSGNLNMGYMGRTHQGLLAGSGDHVTIDWGYLFFASSDGAVCDQYRSYEKKLSFTMEGKTPLSGTLLVGYDDVASILYFGRPLKAYYARNGKTITEALSEFHSRQEEILRRASETDEAILKEAGELGGEAYQKIVTASYRLSIAAHKLVADENGDVLFISKENDSNGCAATVDVSYPSVPLYLLKQPELVRGMLRPIFRFAKMPVWPYDFAPHDAGRYPILDGQVYGSLKRNGGHARGHNPAPLYYYPASENVFDFDLQMPVEESANML